MGTILAILILLSTKAGIGQPTEAQANGYVPCSTPLLPPRPKSPTKAILTMFRSRPLVAIDEGRHMLAQSHKFFRSLISDPAFPHMVNDIVVEFGASRYQDVMDRYTNGESVPVEQLRSVWRETTQVYVFDNPVYRRLFATVREVNRKLPKSRKIRVLLAEPPIDWSQVNDFADWNAQANRDTFAAELVEKEVLDKGRHAILIFGGLGHLQRRDVYANFEASPGKSASVIEQLVRNRGNIIHNIWTNTQTDDLGVTERKLRNWQIPSLINLPCTTLGSKDFTSILYRRPPANEKRTKFVDGKRVNVDKSEFVSFQLKDNFDAILYLGPIKTMKLTPFSSDTYVDDSYFNEVVRRSKILNDFNLDEIIQVRSLYKKHLR